MPDRDHNRHKVYALDSCFWQGGITDTAPLCTPVTFEAWAQYAEMLFTDGLHRPYRHQIRRTRRTPTLCIETLTDNPLNSRAYAWLRRDKLAISEQHLFKWVALHEVAHLLVPGSVTAPHYWRWMSVYIDMVQRHVSHYAAGQFLALAHCFKISWRPDQAS